MIALLIHLIILLIVLGALYLIVKLVVEAFGLPGIIVTVVGILIAVIILLWIIAVFAPLAGPYRWPAL